MVSKLVWGAIFVALTVPAYGQEKDSAPWQRDLVLFRSLLVGHFDNANQIQAEDRDEGEAHHRHLHVQVQKISARHMGTDVFLIHRYYDNDEAKFSGGTILSLMADDETRSLRTREWPAAISELQGDIELFAPFRPHCDVVWRRDGDQFRGTALSRCGRAFADEYVLDEQQFSMRFPIVKTGPYQLDRTRSSE